MKDTEDNPWIKVSDRLPDEDDLVLVLARDEEPFVGYCKGRFRNPANHALGVVDWFLNDPDGDDSKATVTHWSAIPTIPPPQPTAEEVEREAFEEWAKLDGYRFDRRSNDGQYVSPPVQNLWRCWQARAKKGGAV